MCTTSLSGVAAYVWEGFQLVGRAKWSEVRRSVAVESSSILESFCTNHQEAVLETTPPTCEPLDCKTNQYTVWYAEWVMQKWCPWHHHSQDLLSRCSWGGAKWLWKVSKTRAVHSLSSLQPKGFCWAPETSPKVDRLAIQSALGTGLSAQFLIGTN